MSRLANILLLLVGAWSSSTRAEAESPHVVIDGSAGKWTLKRDGHPYFIRGVGGDGSWKLLSELGGNSVRTWGHDQLDEQLDRAHQLGLTVTAGIWLGQVRQGFDWSDAASLIRQRETIRQVVLKYKNHPALLMWSLGNEMEDPEGRNGAVWSEINNLARMVKSLDPRHPTMTVIAELGGDKVQNLHALCPEIDILGINSYAGASSVGERYRKLGGTKPYLLTEFGPPGIWEITANDIAAFPELSSTAKVAAYRLAYQKSVVDQPGSCLGSYAFLWGQKQEVTATWFSLLLPDGSRLGAVDALSEMWTGKPPINRCPEIGSLILSGPNTGKPGEVLRVSLKVSDPEGDPLKITWEVVSDEERYGTGGDAEAAGAAVQTAIQSSDSSGAAIKLPSDGGLYRVFATARDGHGGAAIANVPLRVDAPVRIATGQPAKLPLAIYREDGEPATYVPSGWMGDAKSMRVDPAWKSQPQAGKTCMRCEFGAASGWGGVAWQSPTQDWGDQKGGYNLAGAKRLVFHVRGESGEEEVSFGFGLIGPEKRYFDTARRTLDKVRLTREWQRFEIPVSPLKDGESLTRIKTGFVWTVASSGQPIVFYLDGIQWE